MNKFFITIGGIFLALLLTVLVGVVVYNNVPAVKDWVDGWSTTQEQQPAEDENNNENTDNENGDENNNENGDENNNENTGDETGDGENVTDNNGDENIPNGVPAPDGEEPETNLHFIFQNDFVKIML